MISPSEVWNSAADRLSERAARQHADTIMDEGTSTLVANNLVAIIAVRRAIKDLQKELRKYQKNAQPADQAYFGERIQNLTIHLEKLEEKEKDIRGIDIGTPNHGIQQRESETEQELTSARDYINTIEGEAQFKNAERNQQSNGIGEIIDRNRGKIILTMSGLAIVAGVVLISKPYWDSLKGPEQDTTEEVTKNSGTDDPPSRIKRLPKDPEESEGTDGDDPEESDKSEGTDGSDDPEESDESDGTDGSDDPEESDESDDTDPEEDEYEGPSVEVDGKTCPAEEYHLTDMNWKKRKATIEHPEEGCDDTSELKLNFRMAHGIKSVSLVHKKTRQRVCFVVQGQNEDLDPNCGSKLYPETSGDYPKLD